MAWHSKVRMDLEKYQLFIFDADGTLRYCTVEGQPCPNKQGEWEILPGVCERLNQIDWGYVYFGIASNQRGISLGYMSEGMAHLMLWELAMAVTKRIQSPEAVRLCSHGENEDCDCRKPKPGMLYDLMDHYLIPPGKTLFVGDDETDQQAAEAAGVDFQYAKDFFK